MLEADLLQLLVDPVDATPLTLIDCPTPGEGQGEAVLQSRSGRSYPVRGGIPRFYETADLGQKQTGGSFGYKWQRTADFASEASLGHLRQWLVEKYGFKDSRAMCEHFLAADTVLDAGCGGGMSSSSIMLPHWPDETSTRWVGVDISAAIDVAKARMGHLAGARFVQADVLNLPLRPGTFDLVFSEGVLHHTPSTSQAIASVARTLRPGGEFLFYVYARKGPIREFTDDYIRDAIADLPPEQAMEVLRPLTRLGQAFAELGATIDVPEDVPLLGIKAGPYDVQRLLYYSVAKMFWNPSLSFEENHLINFDWYHPRYAHRQTEEQVRHWSAEAGLRITRLHADPSGYAVRAIRDGQGDTIR